jgi:CheY-like chemotaxis protein
MTKVLLIEDEERFLRSLAISLEARGYEVDTAATGETGLQRAARGHPDVVVLDLEPPRVVTDQFSIDLPAKRVAGANGDEIRLTPCGGLVTESGMVVPVRALTPAPRKDSVKTPQRPR